MPFAICEFCQLPYVVGTDPATPPRCLHCHAPLRPITRSEFFTRLDQVRGDQVSKPPGDNPSDSAKLLAPEPSPSPDPLSQLPAP
jgi:hypothetical protein